MQLREYPLRLVRGEDGVYRWKGKFSKQQRRKAIRITLGTCGGICLLILALTLSAGAKGEVLAATLISILAGSGIHAECSGRNDLTADGRKFGGGVSNADRTPLKKGEVVIDTRSREELGCEGTTVRLTYELRIITEYVDPNYENIYPEEITRRLQPVSWTAAFGIAYDVVITGSKTKGYTVTVSEHTGEAS